MSEKANHTADVADLSYEQARDELIAVVGKLEQGGITLEESITLWERGEALRALLGGAADGRPRGDEWSTPAGRASYAPTEGVEKAMVADLAPDDRRGTAFGWFNMVVGLALLPASIVFGVLYESLSPGVAFGFSGACAFSACLLLWRWFGR